MSESIINQNPLTPLFSLGELYVSDFIEKDAPPRTPKFDMSLAMDETSGLVQLTSQPDAKYLWGDVYWYKSGTNQFMKDALKNVVESTRLFLKNQEGIWLDIASNDGTLLKCVPPTFVKVGIDPSSYEESYKNADYIAKEYFSADTYNKLKLGRKASVVTCCAMFYDLSEPEKFLGEVSEVMQDDGLLVLQLSYTPLMLIQNELGNVCHEHIAYYTLESLEYVLQSQGFKVVDLELNNVNGGSIRVYCVKQNYDMQFKTQADRDIATIRVQSLRDYEWMNDVNSPITYATFYQGMKLQAAKFLKFLEEERAKGKVFYGYGASTKGNTMLQWLGLTEKEIPFIAERQGRKVGLKCVGSNIPVCSEEQARADKPDYMIVFPWHFIAEFKEREKEYLKQGGKFIVLSPKFEIIGYED